MGLIVKDKQVDFAVVQLQNTGNQWITLAIIQIVSRTLMYQNQVLQGLFGEELIGQLEDLLLIKQRTAGIIHEKDWKIRYTKKSFPVVERLPDGTFTGTDESVADSYYCVVKELPAVVGADEIKVVRLSDINMYLTWEDTVRGELYCMTERKDEFTNYTPL